MSKKVKTLVIGGVSLLVLIALMITLIFVFKDSGEENSSSSSTTSYNLVEKNINNIASIEVTNALGGYTITQDDEGVFDVVGLEDFDVNQENAKSAVSQMAVLDANTLVEENATDLAQYGFEDPEAVIVVTLRDGSSYTVTVGDMSPTNLGNYTMVSGNTNVYIVSDVYLSRYYEYDNLYFVSTTFRNNPDNETVFAQKINLYRKDLPTQLYFEKAEDTSNPDRPGFTSPYDMVSPVYSYINTENFTDISGPVNKCYADRAIILHPTEAQLQEYGFKEPQGIYLAMLDEGTMVITAGNPYYEDIENEDGTTTRTQTGYYMMISGVDAIFYASYENIPWMQTEISSILSRIVYAPNISAISGIQIDADGKHYDMQLTQTGDEENPTFTVKINGKEIDPDRFTTFYTYLISARAEGIYTDPVSGSPKVTITFQYLDTSQGELRIDLYDIGDRTSVISVNGEPKFTTRIAYLTNLLSNFELIAQDQNIVTNY